ncbi:glycoside hydrolase family 16 protein [Pedobacter gandavensis]|uniref:glycoside hydrolase family 16 protein n=1 Tax=Pedobacter gandavensis TaxID=2679963 RepID=UPI002478382F|nr:glycoside hydrolase family 16 protein [Pedobacter gandavensis]WGQ09434.1 glycoside hydrolase family 16 protein [Pedobacter gandavensis]
MIAAIEITQLAPEQSLTSQGYLKTVAWEDVVNKPDPSVIGSQYKFSPSITWGDEFNYMGTPDPKKWNMSTGNGYYGWGNHELQYFTGRSKNVKVEDGKLKIIALNESYSGFNYTSGKIVSNKKQRYGRYIIKAKMPLGAGLWPAIFGFGERHKDYDLKTWPNCGEFDIVEIKGQNDRQVNYNVHSANSSGASNMVMLPTQVTLNQFNEYRMDWTPDYIKWYFNGVLMRTFNNNGKGYDGWPFNDYFYLNICLSVGGDFVGKNINKTAMPAVMEIEYVRYYGLINVNKKSQYVQNPIQPHLSPVSAQIVKNGSQTFTVTNVPANTTVHWYALGNDLGSFGLSGPKITITPDMLQAGGYKSGSSFEFFVDFIDKNGVSSKATRATLIIQ